MATGKPKTAWGRAYSKKFKEPKKAWDRTGTVGGNRIADWQGGGGPFSATNTLARKQVNGWISAGCPLRYRWGALKHGPGEHT